LKKFVSGVLIVVFATLLLRSYAQEEDTLTLPVFKLEKSRINEYSSGQKVQPIETDNIRNNPSLNLSDILSQHTNIFFKTYGISSLSTPSFRGTSANHTAILWNGLNLQSSMNGQYDISLIPAFFLDRVNISYGGNSSLAGSGAIGGSINLESMPVFNKGFSGRISTSFGSFNDYFQGIEIGHSGKKFYSSIRLFHHTARNDFKYINTAQFGSPEEKLENAAFLKYGLMQENFVLFKKNQFLKTSLLYIFSDRELPPTMTMNQSISSQEDQNLRANISYIKKWEKLSLIVNTGFLNEEIYYHDPTINLHTENIGQSIISDIELKYKFSESHLFSFGTHNTYVQSETGNYAGVRNQTRNALFASYKYISKNKKLNTSVSGRQEFVDGKIFPFTPALGFHYNLYKHLFVSAALSRNIRIPTFNDWYWIPGGNPDLKPEKSWNQELSLKFENKLNFQITVFNSLVDDWIMWTPQTPNIWTPKNIKEVWSRGFESSLAIPFKLGNNNFEISGMHTYTLSTNKRVSDNLIQTLNKQLIYVPYHVFNGGLSYTNKHFSAQLNYQFVGERYTTTDNSKSVDAYGVMNLNILKKVRLKKFSSEMNFTVRNIFDTDYQVIEWRPMPGRHYLLNLNIYFNHN
jgi:vitamin B12 transporter